MACIQDFVSQHKDMLCYIVAGTAVTASVLFFGKKFFPSLIPCRTRNVKLVECPPDTVLLVQIPRGPYAPSMSPFPLKLETYLRLADIPYVTDLVGHVSSKGKTPWMKYNGLTVEDSQFCIEFLQNTLHKDLSGHLSKADRAAAEAIRIMVDEHTYWCFAFFRWIDDKDLLSIRMQGIDIPMFLLRRFVAKVKQYCYGQGIGRHTAEEILSILRADLNILVDYLGNKPFMTGDTPCVVDCSVFGLLAQFLWHNKSHRVEHIMKDYPTLVAFCERMKEKAWPDWDDCITHARKAKMCRA